MHNLVVAVVIRRPEQFARDPAAVDDLETGVAEAAEGRNRSRSPSRSLSPQRRRPSRGRESRDRYEDRDEHGDISDPTTAPPMRIDTDNWGYEGGPQGTEAIMPAHCECGFQSSDVKATPVDDSMPPRPRHRRHRLNMRERPSHINPLVAEHEVDLLCSIAFK